MAQAASFFSAGFETSATTISFALYELALRPEMQNRLRKEILEALNKSGGTITYDLVRNFRILLHRKEIFVINPIFFYFFLYFI